MRFMHTIETAIVMPVLLLFLLLSVCVCLKYTEQISRHSDTLRESFFEKRISNTDIARGGAVLYETYRKHAG